MVVRVNKTKDYTVMSNYHFKEKEMSLKAKGLLSLMLSLPDDWDYSISGLVSINKENETSIKTILEELKKFKYLKIIKLMPNETESGRIEYIYDIYEKPYEDEEEEIEEKIEEEIEEKIEEKIEEEKTENQRQLNTNNKIYNEEKDKMGHLSANCPLEIEIEKEIEIDIYNIVDSLIENNQLRECIYNFIKMRNDINCSLDDNSIRMIIDKLNSLSNNLEEQIEIVNNSIINKWKNIYPLKKTKNNIEKINNYKDKNINPEWLNKQIKEEELSEQEEQELEDIVGFFRRE